MGLNLLLLVVGLVICFGGIYIRKVCSAILGLIWGALCSFAVILMTVGLWGIDEGVRLHFIVSLPEGAW